MAKMVLKLPKLGASMQEGVIAEWLVAAGDQVTLGQPIYTVESEKTSFEVESPFAGVITPFGKPGETYAVGTPIAEIVT